jgi:hypothetical protein
LTLWAELPPIFVKSRAAKRLMFFAQVHFAIFPSIQQSSTLTSNEIGRRQSKSGSEWLSFTMNRFSDYISDNLSTLPADPDIEVLESVLIISFFWSHCSFRCSTHYHEFETHKSTLPFKFCSRRLGNGLKEFENFSFKQLTSTLR